MDVERAVVSKIIATGQYEKALGKGVGDHMFEDEECRDMWLFIVRHARKHKSAPSLEFVKDAKPGFEFEHIQDSLDAILERFSVLVRKRVAQHLIFDLGAAIDDPERSEQIETAFFEAARELTTMIPSDEVKKFSDIGQRREDYEKRVLEGEQLGIPFGFPTLDEWTGGILPWEFVTCAAFSGVGKSTLLRAVAFNIYSRPADHVGLYISLEENADGILARFDAMATKLSYKKMKQLAFSEEELEVWDKKARAIKKAMNKRDILVIDKIRSCTPDKIFAEITRHQPDICFIDYLSLMRSSSPTRNSSLWQSLNEITQDLKQTARVLEVPILAAAQTNRSSAKEGADLDNIGYSLGIVQDSDIVLGLHADEQMKHEKRMEIRVRKNREGRLGQIKCIWDHDEMVFRQEDMADRFGKPSNNGKGNMITVATLAEKRAQTNGKAEAIAAPKKRPTRSAA